MRFAAKSDENFDEYQNKTLQCNLIFVGILGGDQTEQNEIESFFFEVSLLFRFETTRRLRNLLTRLRNGIIAVD